MRAKGVAKGGRPRGGGGGGGGGQFHLLRGRSYLLKVEGGGFITYTMIMPVNNPLAVTVEKRHRHPIWGRRAKRIYHVIIVVHIYQGKNEP